jgi:hypothetical protein
MNPLTVFPAVASVTEMTGRPGRPRFLGFDPRENPWRPERLIRAPRTLDAPLGFFPSRACDGRLERALTRSPLARFSTRARRRVGGASEFQSAPALPDNPRRQAAVGSRAALIGFLHRHNPDHSSDESSGLFVHLSPEHALLLLPAIFG